MDIVLGGFASENMENLSDEEVEAFRALSEHTDRDLLTWFTGEVPVPKEVATPMFDRVLAYQRSKFS